MLAGAGGIDFVLFIIAADESIKPQTREHFDICRLLRIPAGVIAITKADLVDPELVELVRMEAEEFVRGSFLEGAPVVPVSAMSGAGSSELRDALSGQAERIADKGRLTMVPIAGGSGVFHARVRHGCDGHPGFGLGGRPAGGRNSSVRTDRRVRGVQVHGATAPVASPGNARR